MVTQLLEKSIDSQAQKVFNSLTPEKFAEIEALFHQDVNRRLLQKLALSGTVVGVSSAIMTAGAASATGAGATDAAAGAAASIASGVTNAINMIKAIDGIGLAAFGVALAPMGFMVTLRVLNMVLSRV